MPYVPVHNAGAFGLITDEPDHELPPEAWSSARNIRFEDGYACKFLGSTAVFDPPTVPPYWLLEAKQPADSYWIYAGLDDVYVTDRTSHKKITRAAGIYTGSEGLGWSGGILGGIPVMTNGVDPPQFWDNNFATPGLLARLSNWPVAGGGSDPLCSILRPFREFLVALDYTNAAGSRFPHMIKWSHPADPGSLPSSWDETDATKLAGEKDLSESSGIIVEGRPMRDVLIVYKEDGIFRMQHIGGVLVFRFDTLFTEVGALARRCCQTFRDRQVAFGFEDIIVHDGQTAESIVKRRIQRHIYRNLDADNYGLSFIAVHPFKQELWFCYPTTGAVRPNQAAVWNIRENVWSVRDLPLLSDIKWGIVDTADSDVWDDDSQVWNADSDFWGTRQFNAASLGLLAAQPGSTKLLRLDDTNQEAGTNMEVWLERTGIALVGQARDGKPRVDFTRMKICRGIRPRMQATGPVAIAVGSQDVRGGPVTWSDSQMFDPNVDFRLDFTQTGRLLAVRFWTQSDVDWKLYGYDMDIELLGDF